jgi:transcriptional regulator with XRE-family HTH domain
MFTVEQVKAARALLRWTQEDLASESGIPLRTVKRLEASQGQVKGHSRTVFAIQGSLERAGIVFLNGDEPGVKVRRPITTSGDTTSLA